MSDALKSIQRIEAAKAREANEQARADAYETFKHEPTPAVNPREDSTTYWSDWSGYCGVGVGHVADWIKELDPVYSGKRHRI